MKFITYTMGLTILGGTPIVLERDITMAVFIIGCVGAYLIDRFKSRKKHIL